MSILKDKELISGFAESVGIKKVENDVAELLLSDVETKVLEILQVRISLLSLTHLRNLKNL